MMSLCINLHCQNPQNSDDMLFCQNCGSELLLEGRYRVTRQLGGGGFGKTFEVQDRSGNTKVLKILINNQPKAIELFQQEAQVLSRLHHPGIPRVEPDGYFIFFPRNSREALHCLVMEKVEGENLEEWFNHRGCHPISQQLALDWLTELMEILQQVHQQSFFHRDIKPPNIMLRTNGYLALIDFGATRKVSGTYMQKLAGGQVTGIISAGYTPPEQSNGQAVPQSDFFALGRTFVYLLTGKQPTDPEIYDAYKDEVRWRNYAPHISPIFADLIERLMARSVSQRPADTQEILQRLVEMKQVLNPSPVHPTLHLSVSPTQPRGNLLQAKQFASSGQVSTPGWGFWFRWVLAHFGGVLLLFIGVKVFGFVLFIFSGILIGMMQQWFLRRHIQTDKWVLANAVGFLFMGIITGPVMVWLLRHPKQTNTN